MLQVPVREHTNVASTKAVILVSFLIPKVLKTRLLAEINHSAFRWVVRQEELVSGLCLLMFQRLVFARIQASHTDGSSNLTPIPVIASIRSRGSSDYPPLPQGSRKSPRAS